MTKPEAFISSSDYATLKNDNSGTVTLFIPTGDSVPIGGRKTYENFIDIGQKNAGLRVQNATDLYGSQFSPGTTLITYTTVTIDVFTGVLQTLYVNLERTSPTRLRVYVNIDNNTGLSMTITGPTQTITFDINTFLSPFN